MLKMTKAATTFLMATGIGLSLSGCTMDEVEVPALVGPSQLGLSLQMTALPDVLHADGASQSVVTVVVRDQDGKPAPGKLLYFELMDGDGAIIAGGVLVGRLQGGLAVASDGNGIAQVIYQAGYSRSTVTIGTRPYSFDANGQFLRFVQIDQL